MKRIATLLLLACTASMPFSMNAQNTIKDIFNSAVSKVTSTIQGTNKLNATTLNGRWNYYKPSMKFESNNVLKEVVASAASIKAENSLSEYYTKVGITTQKCNFIFNADSTFTNLMGGHQLNGTYSINEANSTVDLHYLFGGLINYKTMTAKIQMSGDQMNLLFDGDKLLKFLQFASKFSSNETLKVFNEFASQYDGLLVGFTLHSYKQAEATTTTTAAAAAKTTTPAKSTVTKSSSSSSKTTATKSGTKKVTTKSTTTTKKTTTKSAKTRK
jgi:hypothetical protein